MLMIVCWKILYQKLQNTEGNKIMIWVWIILGIIYGMGIGAGIFMLWMEKNKEWWAILYIILWPITFARLWWELKRGGENESNLHTWRSGGQ